MGLVVALAMTPRASADVELFLEEEFSGATAPSGSGSWGSATFSQGGTNNEVILTMALNLTGSSEYLSEWYFNLGANNNTDNSNLTDKLQNLVFENTAGQSGTAVTRGVSPSDGLDATFKADGDGFFDFKFEFPTAGNQDRFVGTETSTWKIKYTGADDFLFTSLFENLSFPGGNNSPNGLYHAAHIQGIGEGGNLSGWVTGDGDDDGITTVPEPSVLVLTAVGMLSPLGVAGVRRWRRRSSVVEQG
jgi:hypothetical protein